MTEGWRLWGTKPPLAKGDFKLTDQPSGQTVLCVSLRQPTGREGKFAIALAHM